MNNNNNNKMKRKRKYKRPLGGMSKGERKIKEFLDNMIKMTSVNICIKCKSFRTCGECYECYECYECDKCYDIYYEREQCIYIDGKYLRWDFVIYINDVKYFVEYDGQQHYRATTFGLMTKKKAEDKFIRTQHNDNLKNEYIKNNGFKLLRIKYTQFKNIEHILTTFINENIPT